jgi:hypothetical protein
MVASLSLGHVETIQGSCVTTNIHLKSLHHHRYTFALAFFQVSICSDTVWTQDVLTKVGMSGFFPRTFTYGLTALPSVCQSHPAASSSNRAVNRPPRRISSSGGPSSTI